MSQSWIKIELNVEKEKVDSIYHWVKFEQYFKKEEVTSLSQHWIKIESNDEEVWSLYHWAKIESNLSKTKKKKRVKSIIESNLSQIWAKFNAKKRIVL